MADDCPAKRARRAEPDRKLEPWLGRRERTLARGMERASVAGEVA